jgi:hypothetical protein
MSFDVEKRFPGRQLAFWPSQIHPLVRLEALLTDPV